MEDYKWLKFAQQKANEYQSIAERYTLARSRQIIGVKIDHNGKYPTTISLNQLQSLRS